MPSLTISIPAYNDAESIEAVIEESLEAAARVTPDFSVLVINDGSGDDTGDRVRRHLDSKPRLRLIEHPKNLGFGPTIREAYTLPESDWVYFIPGDGQVPAAGIIELWPLIGDADFILAHRAQRQDTTYRRIVSGIYNRLISLVAGRKIFDVNASGLLRSDLARKLPLRSNSAFIHAEILLEVLRAGGTVREVAVAHRSRQFGEGRGAKARVIRATIAELARYVLDRRLGMPVWGKR